MESITTTASAIPPLIIIRGREFAVFGSDRDIGLLLKPEAMRRSNGFVIHDPDGSMLERYGMSFLDIGYSVKILNLANAGMGARYNPFSYINNRSGVPKLTAALICGTTGLGVPGDINFISGEHLLLNALISYIFSEAPTNEMNVATLNMLLESMLSWDGDEHSKTAVDYMFREKAEYDARDISVRWYREFKETIGEDAPQVIESCHARLASLISSEMGDFLSDDELLLNKFAFCNTALFVAYGSADNAFGFLTPLFYTQLLDLLCEKSVYEPIPKDFRDMVAELYSST